MGEAEAEGKKQTPHQVWTPRQANPTTFETATQTETKSPTPTHWVTQVHFVNLHEKNLITFKKKFGSLI